MGKCKMELMYRFLLEYRGMYHTHCIYRVYGAAVI
jgi:hypothetical protein